MYITNIARRKCPYTFIRTVSCDADHDYIYKLCINNVTVCLIPVFVVGCLLFSPFGEISNELIFNN